MKKSFKNVSALAAFVKKVRLLSRHGLLRIGVFGSFVRGEEAHDIDILVDDPADPSELIAFREELEKAAGKPVDIVLRRYANPIVLRRAEMEAVYVTES